MSKIYKSNAEKITYYLPVYGYRRFPDAYSALSDLFHAVHNKEKIKVYKDKERAWEEARKLLFDDDACDVVKIVLENARVYLYYERPDDNPVYAQMIHFDFYPDFEETYCEVKD